MLKKKNKIFKKALVFSSVFIILLVSCSTIIFAQAPDYDNVIFKPSNDRIVKIFYFYELNSDNLLATLSVDYITDNVVLSGCNFVFTDYYYNNYYTGNVDNDFLSFSTIRGDIYLVGYSANQTLSQVTLSNTTLYGAISTRGFTSASYSQYFKQSYYNQLGYWEQYRGGYEFGYTKALQDYNKFEEGIYTIFNAPFVFVRNIVGFEIFGITLADILCGILLLCLGFVLLKFIGGAIPL